MITHDSFVCIELLAIFINFCLSFRYSISMQVICDSDKRIIAFHAGCPGSSADSTVFQRMDVYEDPAAHYSAGQYLIADSAYSLTTTCIPSYKAPWTDLKENSDFNHCVAVARVRNEHCIGILNSRWGSLREMRQQLRNKNDMRILLGWVTSCCVLHNMLATLGDSWDEFFFEKEPPLLAHEGITSRATARNVRENLKRTTLEICRSKGLID